MYRLLTDALPAMCLRVDRDGVPLGSPDTEEATMGATDTTAAGAVSEGRIVCELNPSSRAQMLLDDAITRCKATGAALFVVWILEPRMLDTPYPRSSGAVGGWGLPHVLHAAVERARAEGIGATSAVRIGKREVVLRSEAAVDGTVSVYELAA
jgi:hypothetical protein